MRIWIIAVVTAAFTAIAAPAQNPSLADLETKAGQGNADAQIRLGLIYQNGRVNDGPVDQDFSQAMKWFRMAAEQGNADAQFRLAGYETGTTPGIPADYAQAIHWYTLAAEQGNADAGLALGKIYLSGQGVPQDRARAMQWFEKAGARDALMQFRIGDMFLRGKDLENKKLPRDDAKAAYWFHKAATQKEPYAQYYLGLMYYFGKGVPQDDAKALYWFRQGNSQGPFKAIGVMYLQGRGVPKDAAKGMEWIRKAAERRDSEDESASEMLEHVSNGTIVLDLDNPMQLCDRAFVKECAESASLDAEGNEIEQVHCNVNMILTGTTGKTIVVLLLAGACLSPAFRKISWNRTFRIIASGFLLVTGVSIAAYETAIPWIELPLLIIIAICIPCFSALLFRHSIRMAAIGALGVILLYGATNIIVALEGSGKGCSGSWVAGGGP